MSTPTATRAAHTAAVPHARADAGLDAGVDGVRWVVGMDVEWQPSRLKHRRHASPPALLQVAAAAVSTRPAAAMEPSAPTTCLVDRRAYLIDLTTVTSDGLTPFLTLLFAAAPVLKTGLRCVLVLPSGDEHLRCTWANVRPCVLVAVGPFPATQGLRLSRTAASWWGLRPRCGTSRWRRTWN